jgi:hypothetical protein
MIRFGLIAAHARDHRGGPDAHPTISEAKHQAVLDAYGRVIHL